METANSMFASATNYALEGVQNFGWDQVQQGTGIGLTFFGGYQVFEGARALKNVGANRLLTWVKGQDVTKQERAAARMGILRVTAGVASIGLGVWALWPSGQYTKPDQAKEKEELPNNPAKNPSSVPSKKESSSSEKTESKLNESAKEFAKESGSSSDEKPPVGITEDSGDVQGQVCHKVPTTDFLLCRIDSLQSDVLKEQTEGHELVESLEGDSGIYTIWTPESDSANYIKPGHFKREQEQWCGTDCCKSLRHRVSYDYNYNNSSTAILTEEVRKVVCKDEGDPLHGTIWNKQAEGEDYERVWIVNGGKEVLTNYQ